MTSVAEESVLHSLRLWDAFESFIAVLVRESLCCRFGVGYWMMIIR